MGVPDRTPSVPTSLPDEETGRPPMGFSVVIEQLVRGVRREARRRRCSPYDVGPGYALFLEWWLCDSDATIAAWLVEDEGGRVEVRGSEVLLQRPGERPCRLRSPAAERWLRGRFYRRHGRILAADVLDLALDTLAADAEASS